MESKKKKLDVDDAFANWDYCVGCMACFNPLTAYIVAAGLVLVAGE